MREKTVAASGQRGREGETRQRFCSSAAGSSGGNAYLLFSGSMLTLSVSIDCSAGKDRHVPDTQSRHDSAGKDRRVPDTQSRHDTISWSA